jgi:hypothetical protein
MQQNNNEKDAPAILHVEPVLAVTDVNATLLYWSEVLGFENTWSFGNPPNHGGVSWKGSGFIQFALNPELARTGRGHSIWIRARNIDKLCELHRRNGAVRLLYRRWKINLGDLQNIPWKTSTDIMCISLRLPATSP